MRSPKPLNSGKSARRRLCSGALAGVLIGTPVCLLAAPGADNATADSSLPVSATVSAAVTVEEERVPAACQAIKALNCGTQTRPPALLTERLQPLDAAKTKRLGTQLWRRAQQTRDAKIVDDRLLYWQRLSLKRDLKTDHGTEANLSEHLAILERASRGFDDLAFTAGADLNILVTGFDPFGLHNHIDQSNPSGVAALSFDGLVIESGGKRAELQSAMFPVRFEDFDNGMVESVIKPLLASGTIDAIVTISMGRAGFDLERFPGRRRSATAPDNLLVKTGANAKNPLIPLLDGKPLDGPEFVEFTLPVRAMLALQTPYPVKDNHDVTTLNRERFAAASLESLNEATAVSGSGGGYLSNEISYRSVRLARGASRPIAAGHIHTPRIKGDDPAAVHNITWQIRRMLEALITQLPRRN